MWAFFSFSSNWKLFIVILLSLEFWNFKMVYLTWVLIDSVGKCNGYFLSGYLLFSFEIFFILVFILSIVKSTCQFNISNLVIRMCILNWWFLIITISQVAVMTWLCKKNILLRLYYLTSIKESCVSWNIAYSFIWFSWFSFQKNICYYILSNLICFLL